MPYYEVDINDVQFYEQLGAGTYGSVYRALWISRQKIVAVKKLLVLEKEAEVLSTLSHRHIVQFYGACTVTPHYCIVTEYAEQGSLFHYLQDKQIDFRQILLWAKQIGMGLNYLHTEAPIPVVHRDLKSKNVVISADCSAKICDFGSSKFHKNTTKMTLTGTFPWMSPEMIQQLPVSAATDIFSYGVVLWELLTHEVPFRGLEGISVAWLVVGRGVRLTIPESCPEPFSKLMKTCWETDPLKRPNCKQILSKLDVILGNEQLQAETDSFIRNKEEWKKEIDTKMAQLKAMERQLSDKEKELDEREKAIKEKEKKFKERIKTKSLETYDVAQWTEEDVADWVYNIGYSESGTGELAAYAELFKENHISGRRLFLLTVDDLLQIGIFSVGHRREILEEISKLRFDNDRLLHFPPLPGTTPLKAPSRHRSHSVKVYSLTLVYGNLCRKGRTPELNKWKVFVDPDGEAEVKNCIKEVVFIFSKSIPFDIISLMQPPFMMDTWREGCDPGEVECIVQYKDNVRKPKQTKFTFVPTESGFQEEVTVEIDVCLSSMMEKLSVPATSDRELPAPSLDVPTGMLESESGVPPLDVASGVLVDATTTKPPPSTLQGIWKDRSIFSVKPAVVSPSKEINRRHSTPVVVDEDQSDYSWKSASTYRGPNLKGAWATTGKTGAKIVSTGTGSSQFPVEEVGRPTQVTSCYAGHCHHHCLCPHHAPGMTHGCCLHPASTPHSSRPLSGLHSGESSMTSSYGSYSSQDSWNRMPERSTSAPASRGMTRQVAPRQGTPNRQETSRQGMSRQTSSSQRQYDGNKSRGSSRGRGNSRGFSRGGSSNPGQDDIRRSQSDGQTPHWREGQNDYSRSQSDKGSVSSRGRGRGRRGRNRRGTSSNE